MGKGSHSQLHCDGLSRPVCKVLVLVSQNTHTHTHIAHIHTHITHTTHTHAHPRTPTHTHTHRDGSSLECRHEFHGHRTGVVCVDVSSDGTMAASSSIDSQIRTWTLDTTEQAASGARVIDSGPINAWCVAIAPDGRTIASGAANGNINIYSTETGAHVAFLETKGAFVYSLSYVSVCECLWVCGCVCGCVGVCCVNVRVFLCACVCAYVYACMYMCMCMCLCVCVCVCVC
jgi:WD40 repeat protein